MRISSFLLILLMGIQAILSIPTASNTSSTVIWHDCPSNQLSGFQCAEFGVPLDWDNSNSPFISIHMIKLPATNPEKRIGALFFNPGGPGGSPIDVVSDLPTDNNDREPLSQVSSSLRERFDIIGQDPRGVGHNLRIQCNATLWNRSVKLIPQDEVEFDEINTYWRTLNEDCRAKTGSLIDHVDTVSAAKDMEAIRVALGEGPLNYFGTSYGTQLGSQYAELYPNSIRAMCLDSVLDHSKAMDALIITGAQAYEETLNRFLDWASTSNSSALYGRDTGLLFDKLVRDADKKPIPAPSCEDSRSPCQLSVTGEMIKIGVQQKLSNFSEASKTLLQTLNGDAHQLSLERPIQTNDFTYDTYNIWCQDWYANITWTQMQNLNMLLRDISPRLQGVSAFYFRTIICAGWRAPLALANPPKRLRVPVTRPGAPILLVNALYDQLTSYESAVSLQTQLKGSVLLTRNGTGHISYGLLGETRKAIDTYLIDLKIPESGIVLDS